ncbi:MAG: peptidase Ste24p [Polaromonas sp.]|nr:peptidase Ste24p [Polaromonas sp.]
MRFFERQEDARAQTLRLLLLFGLTLLALVVTMNVTLALAWHLVSVGSAYPAHFFAVNTAVTLLFVLGGWWLETSALQGGGQVLARRAGAREAWPASREAEHKLCNIVDELAIAASMKPPLAMVLPRVDAINAFATGWGAEDAVIAVTQGALDKLTRDELQGIVAHELSHLHEGDTRLNMRLAGMVLGLELVFNLGQSMCATDQNGRRSWLALPGVPILITGSLGWLAGRALKAAISRQREFLADARAVQFTRSREGLGGVLRKVAGEQLQGFWAHRSLHPAVQHMLLVDARDDGHWFASHPPLSERIRQIYGRPMGAISPHDRQGGRPDTVF